MNAEYNIDSHKLHLHPQRVAAWMQGENIYPIYVEVSPSGACNHRCTFCTMDFMGYKARFLPTEIMCTRLTEMGKLGVKSIMFAGEGEPLLHKDIALLATTAHDADIDISFTTNAVLLTPKLAQELLPITSWIKISCNAGTRKDYASIHKTQAEDFDKAIKNLAFAAEERARQSAQCTLGIQSVLLPENQENMIELARIARESGADYFVIKPYTHNPQSLKDERQIKYAHYGALAESLQQESRPNFRIIFRHEAMERWDAKADIFNRCLALPFWAYIDSSAAVKGCIRHLQHPQFYYGSLLEHSFASIWQGKERREKVRACTENFDVQQCHVTCRMEVINNYLWRLRHPYPHDNFI